MAIHTMEGLPAFVAFSLFSFSSWALLRRAFCYTPQKCPAVFRTHVLVPHNILEIFPSSRGFHPQIETSTYRRRYSCPNTVNSIVTIGNCRYERIAQRHTSPLSPFFILKKLKPSLPSNLTLTNTFPT